MVVYCPFLAAISLEIGGYRKFFCRIIMNKTKKTTYEIDMLNGPLLGKIIIYAIPLVLSGMLQIAFNAVDLIIVGQFAGSNAMAAVGCTSSLTNLIVSLFIGISAGANVLVARFYGAGQKNSLKEVVHTSVAISIIAGVILAVLGFVISKPILSLMGTPEELISGATLYMRIYFAGMPFIMLYNFGSAILRGVGDSRRPLYYISIAGVLNVLLNILFVRYMNMGEAGVALGTVLSQMLSVVLLIRTLMKTEGAYKLIVGEIKIYRDKLMLMLKIGLPAGVQSCLFSFSNVILQSSINGFGADAVAGNTAAGNIESLVYTAMNAFYQTSLSFVGQNYGAGKITRIKKISAVCLVSVFVCGAVLSLLGIIFGEPMLKLYGASAKEIEYGLIRLSIVCSTYYLCGIMDTLVGILRGLGYAIMPMIVSLSGACLLRIIWVMTVFQMHKTLNVLYTSYPVTWFVTASIHFICLLFVFKHIRKTHPNAE